MVRRAILLLGVAGSPALFGGCDLIFSNDALRYRMTMIIDTPDGERTGSSVIESTIEKGTGFGDASGISYRLKGEAVPVSLPNGKVVFALLLPQDLSDARFYQSRLILRAACRGGRPSIEPDPSLCAAGQWREFRRWAREKELSVEIAPSEYPLLVTFSNVRDPSTIAAIDPVDFGAMFGSGYRLRAITAEVTTDSATNNVEKLLPAEFFRLWAKLHGQKLAASSGMFDPYFKSLLGSLNKSHFISEK